MQKRIRIVHIAQAAGGVEQYIKMLLKYMDSTKFENILIASKDYHAENYVNLVDAFEQVDMSRAIGMNDLNAARKVRTLIKQYKPDIVYAHSSKAGAIARIANLGLKNRLLYNPHGWAFNMKCSATKQRLYTAIERMEAPFCDRIICISEAERKSALAKKICADSKLQVVFNGVDIEAYEQKKHKKINKTDLKIQEDAFVVGMVGRISPQKAPDVFIRAAKLIKQEVPEAHFIIVGGGEMENEIKQYARENGLEDCLHITGWVDDPLTYVELFDVACLLSRWEGFGLVLPEYMMVGKPIVATQVDAIPNIISDHKNGLLVKVDDEAEVSRAVIEIQRNPNLKNKLVQQGQKDVRRRFDAKRVSYEHELLFRKLAEQERSGE